VKEEGAATTSAVSRGVQAGSWSAGLLLVAATALCAQHSLAREAPAVANPWKPGEPIPSLSKAYKGQFLIGAAVSSGMVLTGEASKFVEHQFNVIVAENEMKPHQLSKAEGQYDFAAADALVDWANKNGIKVRGHTLIWHQHAPPWIFTQDGHPVSRDLLVERMRAYIHDVVGHFRGRVFAWDVVNEAFVPGEAKVESVDGWRRSGWYDILGPDYIPLAFQFAHEADPGALLFYNDYDTQAPAKRSMILELVRSLKKRGIAIHGIGHQAHYTLTQPDPSELEATLREVARLGLRNHITEMDISLRERWDAPVPEVTAERLALQAQRWVEFFRMFRRNEDKIDAVLFWGVNDENSWLGQPDEPLLFKGFEPKPAFWAVYREARQKLDGRP
jgi:endo-1,4-beta-xylanase